jgi:hypothetical protein
MCDAEIAENFDGEFAGALVVGAMIAGSKVYRAEAGRPKMRSKAQVKAQV